MLPIVGVPVTRILYFAQNVKHVISYEGLEFSWRSVFVLESDWGSQQVEVLTVQEF